VLLLAPGTDRRPPGPAERRSQPAAAGRGRRLAGLVPGLEPVPGLGIGLGMGLSMGALLIWGLGRPAFWLDEGASVVATQRSWPDLFRLLQGADAPLVPYYTVLKVLAATVERLAPGLAGHPELMFRLPSAIAVTLASALLIGWLSRTAGPLPALATGALLLLTGGVSRYGQEARPYGLVLLGAVLATLLWTGLVRRTGPWWVVGYGLTVAAMVALHDLSAVLVAAHAVAAVTAVEPGRRRTAAVRTAGAGGLGLALVSPLAITTARHGGGATKFLTLTPAHLLSAFVGLFSATGTPLLGVGPIVLLALLGLTRIWSTRERFAAQVAAAWAIVPPALLVPAVMLRPNLLIGRYLMFAVPAWTVLAGLGLLTLADAARAVLARARFPRPATGVAALAVAAAVLAGTALVQVPTLVRVRTVAGHGEDIRPALAAASQASDARLPIVVSSRLGAIELGAYQSPAQRRLLGLDVQRDGSMIWPVSVPYPGRSQLLKDDPRLLLLLRDPVKPGCVESAGVTSAAQIARCMPAGLRRLHYRVLGPGVGGFGWSLSTLARSATRRSPKPSTTAIS
jgi:hypothetical protein